MKNKDWKGMHNTGGGAVYSFGLLGSLIYFVIHAQTAGQVLLGILKSIVWPAIFVFKIFEFLRV